MFSRLEIRNAWRFDRQTFPRKKTKVCGNYSGINTHIELGVRVNS